MNGCKANGNGSGGCGIEPGSRQAWKVGLLNHQGRYLTAESFGCKINASGSALKRKQLWTIEQDPQREDTVYIKSYLARYLAGDKKGNATCSTEEEPGAEERFVIQYHGDGSGRWALRNEASGYYFGGSEDQLQCYEKQPGKSEWWTVHLAIHPQVALRNNNRQKYARLNPEGEGRLEVNALVPWGQRSQVTVEFRDGGYCLRCEDGRYLHRGGGLVADPSPDTAFSIELKSGQSCGIAFKDREGRYLTAVGREAVMQTRNTSAGKDELFTLECSCPQVTVTAHNGKLVTYKQGVDLSANKDLIVEEEGEPVSDEDIYQLEFDREKEKWRVMTADMKYWSLEAASGIQAVSNTRSAQGLFSLEWCEDGSAAIKAGNNRYVTARMNGSLYAVSDVLSDKEKFRITIVNKDKLILRCEHGFIGLKSSSGSRLDCSRPTHEFITLISTQQLLQQKKPVEDEDKNAVLYSMKSSNGKYWTLDSDNCLSADSVTPVWLLFELYDQCKVAIKTRDGRYLTGEQNGLITAKSSELEKATLWEF